MIPAGSNRHEYARIREHDAPRGSAVCAGPACPAFAGPESRRTGNRPDSFRVYTEGPRLLLRPQRLRLLRRERERRSLRWDQFETLWTANAPFPELRLGAGAALPDRGRPRSRHARRRLGGGAGGCRPAGRYPPDGDHRRLVRAADLGRRQAPASRQAANARRPIRGR